MDLASQDAALQFGVESVRWQVGGGGGGVVRDHQCREIQDAKVFISETAFAGEIFREAFRFLFQ